ncbi:MAG: GNAT family N-acetyltransferase [Pseudomonadota bacterium]|jgi:ribosomal-protein-alanine N-acetyltransferase|nr:GNAT family N-acetyltransferase [Xanthomonadaceae bacterium]MDE2249712.1 GNAT family N-acetyltransferase [Xanthomonadaceae bacterium]MDE3211254.1 GNAT family N-acetyltransferase [Pseudomonadota bacterium]
MNAPVLLRTAHTRIRLPEPSDAPGLLRYRLENRAHLAPWEPLREESYYALEQCAQAIADGREAARLDRGYPLVVFAPDEEEILASLTLSNIVRGPFQACLLGYGVGIRRQGTGLMHEALEAGLAWAFGELGLHRVMANYLPRNERSARLLQRLGFEREGYARSYLRIAGRWEDHVLTARIRPDD